MNKILILILVIGFCQSVNAQLRSFNQGWSNNNRGGWNNGMQNFNRGGFNNGMQNFNRGGFNNGMQNFNRGGFNNGMQNFNRGSFGNNNLSGQFYNSNQGGNRIPVRNNSNNQRGQPQGQGQQQGGSSQQNNGYSFFLGNIRRLSMNNGYPQGRTGGYWRVDTKRNKWTFVPWFGQPTLK